MLSRWTYGSVVLGFVKGELKEFEDDMLKMIQSPKFKQVNNPFLNKLKDYADRIRNETKLLIEEIAFCLAGHLRTAILADTIYISYLKITPKTQCQLRQK